MKLYPDEEDRLWRDAEETPWFRFSTPLRYIIFLILLIGLLIGVWYLMAPRRQWYNKSSLALIRADETPYKMKAENQGVPSVKHQDKLVYGRIRADQNTPLAEHILPDPETPLPQIKEESKAIKMIEQYTPEDKDPGALASETEEEKSEENSLMLASIEDLIEELPEAKQEVEKKNIKGNTLIQLGSLKSYDMAEAEWKRILKKNVEIVGELEPLIQKIDLGEEQGIYYRLRTGPFETPEKASKVCSQLKEQKVECVVVR